MFIRVLKSCIGCGICSQINPEVFELYKNYATVNRDKIEGNEESCIDAALNCPVDAIDLNEY
ncbi:MAG: ferredoxin [Clostridiaceae bacterium]|jgi:ferredoxin|nr:ferredoxin [Clostridiaceae bacterium]